MCAVLQVYNLSAGKSLPQWLAEAQKKKQSLGCIVIVAMWLWLDKHKHIITSGRLQVWTHLWISFLHVSANLSKDIEGICRCSIEPWNHQICCWGRFGAMRTGCHNFATIIYRINIDQHLAVRQPQISGFQEAHRLDSGRKWGDRKTFKAMKEVYTLFRIVSGDIQSPRAGQHLSTIIIALWSGAALFCQECSQTSKMFALANHSVNWLTATIY